MAVMHDNILYHALRNLARQGSKGCLSSGLTCEISAWMRDRRLDQRNKHTLDLADLARLKVPSVHPFTVEAKLQIEALWLSQAPQREDFKKLLARIPKIKDASNDEKKAFVKHLTRLMHALNCHIQCPDDGVPGFPVFLSYRGTGDIYLQHSPPVDRGRHTVDWTRVKLVPKPTPAW